MKLFENRRFGKYTLMLMLFTISVSLVNNWLFDLPLVVQVAALIAAIGMIPAEIYHQAQQGNYESNDSDKPENK